MKYNQIVLSKRGSVAWLEMNRPDRRNSLTDECHGELVGALRQVSEDDSLRVLVLSGRGRDFCVGAELSQDHPSESMLTNESAEGIRRAIRYMQQITRMLHEMEKPTIAMVNGAAAGAGMDFALACDIRVGSPTAKFRSFIQAGLVPGLGGAWLMVRLLGYAKACEMFFRGQIVGAEEALDIGLLNLIAPEADLEKTTFAMANEIAEKAPIALKCGKVLLREAMKTDFGSSSELTSALQAIVIRSADHAEARSAFLKKRAPSFTDS